MNGPPRIAGAEIEESRPSQCKKCHGPLLLGLVRVAGGRLKWCNFDAKPVENNGLRVYLRHACPP
jgi:hypothetical protein